MLERRLQVFVSSTYEDLREERQAAVETILAAGHIPAGMELFAAGDASQLEVIRDWIKESDVFLLILGGRYGTLEPVSGESYVHLEYEYAISLDLPSFALVIKEDALDIRVKRDGLRAIERESEQKYKEFRKFVLTRLVKLWESKKDIQLAILQKLGELSQRRDLVGWVRADRATEANPAPAVVQGAHYKVHGKPEVESSELTRESRLALLNTASFLLYGHPDREATHSVRSALRPSTGSRQLEVVESLVASGSAHFLAGQFYDMADVPWLIDTATERGDRHWVRYFTKAAWSLFNVHRNLLREFDLNLDSEDVFISTRTQLRHVVLEKILVQSREKRQALLDCWRSRSDEHRSQVFSLLAAEVFRPWMEKEDSVGDYQRAVKAIQESTKRQGVSLLNEKNEISAAQGIVWFLNLVIGFFQPLVLARNRAANRQLTGIGWDLRYGPINAIRVADSNQEILSTGMMFIDPKSFSEALSCDERFEQNCPPGAATRKTVSEDELFLRLWSSYGYSRGHCCPR